MTRSTPRHLFSLALTILVFSIYMIGLTSCTLDSEVVDSASVQDPLDPTSVDQTSVDPESGWSTPVVVGRELENCVSYRARIQGEYLVVEASHGSGWHTYALDNEIRAEEMLAGQESLGVELPTSFEVRGAKVVGPWLQTEPEDLSEVDIQWYTFGFSDTATFAAKIQDVGTTPIVIGVRGQVCNADICRDIEIDVRLDPTIDWSSLAFDPQALVPIRTRAPK